MQQNIRAAMLTLTRDIREAGCDPREVAGARIVTAAPGQIRFTRDVAGHAVNPNNADGDVLDLNEDLIFGIDPAVDTDASPDGIPNTALVGNLTRNDVNDGTGIFQPIAQNIERLEFTYIDENGAVIAMPITSQADINRIRAVQVSILVRSADQDINFRNSLTYTTASGAVWGPFNDTFRRRFIATTIKCRNMGL
jgi:type IV pilus assembly protein PilW